MIIAEQFVKGKHDEASCEDGIVATAHFVAAIDGSTSKGVRRVDPEKSNGRLCMEVVADYIRHMDAETSLDDFCEGVTKAIHDIYVERGFTGSEPMAPVDRLCASAVVYSQWRQEVWMIGLNKTLLIGQIDIWQVREVVIGVRGIAVVDSELIDVQQSVLCVGDDAVYIGGLVNRIVESHLLDNVL